jgi:hypothetical protein
MSSIKLIFATVIFLNLFSLSSLACSYADGYLPPTEYDLIKEADAIVLARPVSKSGYIVDFKVIEVLKGDFHGSEFRGAEAHTSCVDYSYSVGIKASSLPQSVGQNLTYRQPKYLLFLRRMKDGWTISSQAAQAMNEIIFDTSSSAFLTTVRQLIRVSSKNNYEIEMRELKSLRQLARTGRNPRQYPKELAGLIDHHLTSPTPSKSYKDLLELYTHAPKDRKRDALWAMAWGKHAEAADFFTRLLRSPLPLNYIGPISEYITQTKNETLLVMLGRNYPKQDKGVRWPLMWALIKTADERHKDLMLSALRSADKEEAGRLAEWFVRYPAAEATEIVRRHVGNDYQSNSELTFELAGMGDQGALAWAREFMKPSSEKDRWMAYYTIAYSPLDEADILAKSVIERNDPKDLIWLIQGYKDSHNPNRWSRLRDIINSPTRDSSVDDWLKRTLEEMADDNPDLSAELSKILQRPKS